MMSLQIIENAAEPCLFFAKEILTKNMDTYNLFYSLPEIAANIMQPYLFTLQTKHNDGQKGDSVDLMS